jgi:hypothetical protein
LLQRFGGAGAEFRVERGLLKSSFLKTNFNKMLSKPQSTKANVSKKEIVRNVPLFKMHTVVVVFLSRYSGQELTEYHDNLFPYFADTTEKRGYGVKGGPKTG